MRNYDQEMDILIQKYLLEIRKESFTLNEISNRPYWKRGYFWWKALEHFENKLYPEAYFGRV